ncbi:MAG: ABC transporter ATP-binding protein [Planctomycetota bacterium]
MSNADETIRDLPAGETADATARAPATTALDFLSVRDIRKSYRMGRQTLDVLRGVDLDVKKGEIVAIMGQSGSGKSTLLHQIGLLDEPESGEVYFEGDALPRRGNQAAAARSRLFGFIFQFYHLLPEFTALENVLMPAMILDDLGVWRRRKGEHKERAARILERMGLKERMKHRPKELSGGERQRVAIARALMNKPPVLLCDEPTGNLDRGTAEGVRSLLWELNQSDGQTMIVVTHDSSVAAQANRTLELVDGRLANTGSSNGA